MNKKNIWHYVKLYKGILAKYQILIAEKDLSNIYQLILLVFELDEFDLKSKLAVRIDDLRLLRDICNLISCRKIY